VFPKMFFAPERVRNPASRRSRHLIAPGPYQDCCTLPCHILDCYTTILADDLIRLSFVSVSSGGSRATNRRLPGDVCVPVCKVLYPSSDIDSVHSGFVICALKSILHIRCGGFLLYKQSYPCTLPKRGVASRFIALKCDRGTRAVGLILIPV
jgi:hypothetical protein